MLSVIVTVYNGEKYIEKCLNSILNQTYKAFEVICVDDGSTDNSLLILSQYSNKDNRIKIIHKQKNQGLVATRISGIDVAEGEYVAYVDCDDWIEPNMFADMMTAAERNNVDIVTSGTIYDGKLNKISYDGFDEGLYKENKLTYIKEHIFFSQKKYEEGIRANLVNKIFKKELINKVQSSISSEVSYGEDRLCTLKCVLEADSVYVLHKAYYHYVVRDNSMSSGKNLYFLEQVGVLYREIIKVIEKCDYKVALYNQCGFYITQLLMRGINDNLGINHGDILWIHPSWINQIPQNSKVVLYGCGRRGKAYFRQIRNDCIRNIEIVAWVDKNHYNLNGFPVDIQNPEHILEVDFDYIIISIENNDAYNEIKEWLVDKGIDSRKILRPMPRDSFWEYAESAGLYK